MFVSGWKHRRQDWSRQLRELTDRPPESAEDLLRTIVEKRGNTLMLLDDKHFASVGGPCGLYLSAPGVDMVWVDPNASGTHRDAILCHEAGHILNNDAAAEPDPDVIKKVMAGTFQYLDPALVESVLGRRAYGERRERRAEVFGTWASLQLARQRGVSTDPVLSRVRGSLDSRLDFW